MTPAPFPDAGTEATHIVVGGGSAGAVVAARLSEDRATRVLLLEAGPDRNPIAMRMPAGLFGLIGNPAYDWCYSGRPDPTLGNRALVYPAGRVLGGSSAINGLVYGRGSRDDFSRWEAAGATGWSWSDVLPFFLRSECFDGQPSQDHGTSGALGVSRTEPHPLAERFLAGCAEIGMRLRKDASDGHIDGAFPTCATIRRGRRAGTRAFLEAAKARPNLRVETGCIAERLVIEDGVVRGVVFRRGGEAFVARAAGEVVLCAGAFGTPLLLQRSGLGPGGVLVAHGIGVVRDLPGIGANLRDHLANGIACHVDAPSFNDLANPIRAAGAGLAWLIAGRGPLGSVSVHAMAYGRSDPDLPEPDFMLSMLPVNTDWSSGKPRLHRRRGMFLAVNACRTLASGTVAIGGAEAADLPVIDYPLLNDPRDRQALRGGLETIRRLLGTAPIRAVLSPDQPERLPHDETGWAAWLTGRTALGYHSVGTCRMGGATAPLDPQLRLRGVGRLRVADASAMPDLISANTNATAVMIGERAADFMRPGS